MIRDISHNLPLAARSLRKMNVNTTLQESLVQAERLTQQFGSQTFVSLNHKPMTMGLIDPFALYQVHPTTGFYI